MNTTLVEKMTHSDCPQHHYRTGNKNIHTKSNGKQTSAPLSAEKWPPEFLHCGVWPPPHKPSEADSGYQSKTAMQGKSAKLSSQPTQVYPDNIPNLNGNGTDSEGSESGLDGSEDKDDDDMAITPAEPLTVTWDALSDTVDILKMVPNSSGEDETSNGNGHGKFNTPYSVLKLVAQHSNGSTKQPLPPLSQALQIKQPTSPRQKYFDQELQAEYRARLEITDYLDTLADHGEFEEGYGCVWPLEDYRRGGWAKEMVAAYPSECVEFVTKAREQLDSSRQRRERGKERF